MIAGTLTSIGFVPQIIKIIKTRKSDDVSLLQPLILSIGFVFWLAYGIILQEIPMILANIFGLSCNLILLGFKIKDAFR